MCTGDIPFAVKTQRWLRNPALRRGRLLLFRFVFPQPYATKFKPCLASRIHRRLCHEIIGNPTQAVA